MTARATSGLSPLVPEIVALLGGIVSAVIIALPANTFLNFVTAETVLLAPLIEEPAKAIGVLFLAIYYPYVVSRKSSGILLGGLAGLGFAFTENLFYATMPQTDIVARALLPVPMHIMASGVAALGLVYVAQRRRMAPLESPKQILSRFYSRNVVSLLAVAVAIHTQYNLLSYFGYPGSMLGLMIAGFVYYRVETVLPEDLRLFTAPSPIRLITSTVRVKVLRHPFHTSSVPPTVGVGPAENGAFCIICGHRISQGESYCDRCGESQR